MNDELLLKLKNAGFPIQQTCGHCGEGYGADVEPTLSELIEACGKGFGALERLGDQFLAVEPRGKQTIPILAYQESPDIAVANLYLALHPSE